MYHRPYAVKLEQTGQVETSQLFCNWYYLSGFFIIIYQLQFREITKSY